MKKYIRAYYSPIYGMAMKRHELGNWIEDHTFQVMVALAQLYLFPKVTTRSHWRMEVWEKFHEMHLLKKTNKLPNAMFIYDCSWGRNSQFVHNAKRTAINKEKSLKPCRSANEQDLADIMDDYFVWLSTMLAKNKYIEKELVFQELDNLGLTE